MSADEVGAGHPGPTDSIPEGTSSPNTSSASASAFLSGTPTEPDTGFSWFEVGLIAGVCLLLATISFLSTLNSPCCAPSTQAETIRSAGRTLSDFFLWGLASFVILWACAQLRPRSVGWGLVISAHLLLAALIPFGVEVGQGAVRAGMMALSSSSDACDCSALDIWGILTGLEFLSKLGPYLILFVIGMGRYRYLQFQARQERSRRAEREAEQLRAQLNAARLEALRMQINPHFLFNTLNTVSTMAGTDPHGIRNATARLSEILRYALSTSDQQEVPLEEELDVLRSYLDLQKLRLGDKLTTSIDVEPGIRQALVPTLLLQPLAENAVQHGFTGDDRGGHLAVRALRERNELLIEVADDGVGPSDEMHAGSLPDEGRGLPNLAERIESLYGDAASLTFEPSSVGGLRVVVRLPFHTRPFGSNLRVPGVASE